mgnify:CR=1 FL=1
MFVPQFLSLKLLLVRTLVNTLKHVFKEPVIPLKNSVLSAEIERVVLMECIFETSMGKALDGFFSVVHAEVAAFALEIIYLNVFFRVSIGRFKN